MIGQQVGADGTDGVGRSSGCEDDQSSKPNRGQVVYRLMPRPVVSVLGELECWVTFSPRAQRWLHFTSSPDPLHHWAYRPVRADSGETVSSPSSGTESWPQTHLGLGIFQHVKCVSRQRFSFFLC